MVAQPDEISPEPEPALRVTSMEAMKLVADPLRQRIIDLLRAGPATVSQLAEALAVARKKLYYHVNLLQEHGLVKVVGARLVSGIVEKQYRAAAYIFQFEMPDFIATGADKRAQYGGLMSNIFDIMRGEIDLSLRGGTIQDDDEAPAARSLFSQWDLGYFTPDEAERFRARLRELVDEFPSLTGAPELPEQQRFRFFTCFYPLEHLPALEADPADAGGFVDE